MPEDVLVSLTPAKSTIKSISGSQAESNPRLHTHLNTLVVQVRKLSVLPSACLLCPSSTTWTR